MARFKYTRGAANFADTQEKRDAIEKLSEKTFTELSHEAQIDGDFLTTFEYEGQLFIMWPSHDDINDVIVDTGRWEKMEFAFPDGHEFEGKELMIPVADSDDDEGEDGHS